MKYKIRRALAFLLAVTILTTGVSGSAVSFGELDVQTAFAGASEALSTFYETNEDAAEKLKKVISANYTEEETEGALINLSEVLYAEPKTGVVDVDAFLNVRTEPSAISDVQDCLFRGDEVQVIGIVTRDSKAWYKITVDGITGYAAANYLVFGDEAEALKEEVQESLGDPTKVPESCELLDDISALSDEEQAQLTGYIKEANYVIKYNYPDAVEQGDYQALYYILTYLLELYQYAEDITVEYGLILTKRELEQGLSSIALNITSTEETLAALETTTEATTEATAAAAAPTAATAAATAAPTAAATAAPATAATAAPTAAATTAATAAATTAAFAPIDSSAGSAMGVAIANYAASWVGRIAYVWGGNEFYEGGGVDCSHFTYNVYKNCGINVGYTTSYGQRNYGYAVDISQIQPGDLVCYNGHVAIYYGNGQVIHAPAPGRYIEVGNLYMLPIVCIRRLY